MDYKKKYKEALERARAKYAMKDQPIHQDLVFIFPELAKNDDEMIKEKIIATIHLYYGEPLEDEAKEMIAWIEKQGDKVSAIEGFETEFEKQVSRLIASAINREHEYNEGYVKWTANALLNYAKHELEKQGEQNSTWTENDKEELKIALDTLEEAGQYSSAKWLKNVCLVPQTMQKSWSEEDEKMRASIIFTLAGFMGNEDKIDWLKSLKDRCTWKPSDKQLEALKEACDEHWEPDGLDPLYTLYQELKKTI